MVQYEVSCSALRRSLRNRQPILRGIRSASASAVSAAGNLAAAGSAFREVSVVLRRISQDLKQQEAAADALFSALEAVCQTYSAAEKTIAGYGQSDRSGDRNASLAPEPEAFTQALTDATGHSPYSPVLFSTSDTAGKAAYLSSLAGALLSQFPGIAMSIGSRIEFPTGGGMTVYGSASVSGTYTRSDHVKISHALDTNTGLFKESISVSDDGKTISFTKDGVNMSVKTETGTWRIDPTSLSRTTGAQIDDMTRISFTEKVNAEGMSSMEESVTTKAGAASVTTTIGVKPSDPQKPKPGPSPVPVPGLDTAIAQRERMTAYEKILAGGLAGDMVPVPGTAVPQPVFVR